jgi:hypothetical protein
MKRGEVRKKKCEARIEEMKLVELRNYKEWNNRIEHFLTYKSAPIGGINFINKVYEF